MEQNIVNEAALKDRDYTVIIDKSGSMHVTDTPQGSRWKSAFETTLGFAHKMATLDPDGLTLYLFNNMFKRHDNVKPDAIQNVWDEHNPSGSTNLAAVLKDSLDNFFYRKERNEIKANGEIILVVTDGVPDDEKLVQDHIVAATKKMTNEKELGILFLQVGQDPTATQYLQKLDDDLVAKAGAKWDIVDTKTYEQIGNMSLTQVLLDAIND